MKVGRALLIVMMVGSLAVIGCGGDGTSTDDTPGGGSNGNTENGTNGGGECNTGECVNDSTKRTACEAAVAACRIGPASAVEGCIEFSIADICLDQTNPM